MAGFGSSRSADQGNIYFLYNGLIPERNENYDWSQYLRGDTSATLWTKFLPFVRLPQVLNPASGFVQNSNSTPFHTTIGSENPDPVSYSSALGIETSALIESFVKAVNELKETHGRVEVRWGDVHRLQHGKVDLPVGGGPDVLHAIYAEETKDHRWRGIAGDSYVLQELYSRQIIGHEIHLTV